MSEYGQLGVRRAVTVVEHGVLGAGDSHEILLPAPLPMVPWACPRALRTEDLSPSTLFLESLDCL